MSSSVSGVSSSNASSIYGNRNVLSGLATGLDTESMIENAVSGYNTKISNLQQKQTKLTWKQEAYRSITNPLIQFSRKYTSYTSSTNLYSASFFNSAVISTANGTNAAKVSASGKTSSEIELLGVSSLAEKASCSVGFRGAAGGSAAAVITGSSAAADLSASMQLSAVSGTLSLSYNNKSIDLTFDDVPAYGTMSEFADAINKKLANETYITSDGDSVAASTMMKAVYDESSGKLEFVNKKTNGAAITVKGTSGSLASTMSVEESSPALTLKEGASLTVADGTVGMYLSGKTISVTLDGVTKTIALSAASADENQNGTLSALLENLNSSLKDAFGTAADGAAKVSVSSTEADGKLVFTGSQAYSTLSITASKTGVLQQLGLDASSTSYVDTGKTLQDLLGGDGLDGLTANDDGTYDVVINDVKVGSYSADTALETILSDINSSSAGVTVTYSKTTNQFRFLAKETGANGQISIRSGTGETNSGGAEISNLAAALFGTVGSTAAQTTYTSGKDAVFTIKINGGEAETVTRSSNNFNVDGLSITLKGVFADDADDPVTFTTSADADKIVDAVKSMVDDLNAIMKAVHDAYSTQPLTKSNGKSYDPLTEDDSADMSDTAIEAYETKAKTGLLFGDSDLSSLYSKLLSAVRSSGTAGAALRGMGITTSYSEGLTVLSVDEDALRDTLETNPDAVRDAFTGSGGLMVNLKSTVDAYAATTGATKGILIQKAGSTYSSLSLLDNDLQDQIGDLDDQIEKWQDKLSDKIDYYTSMFTKLEKLTSQMNSQSSLLSSMLGS